MIEVVTLDTPSLGDRTYLATDGVSGLVIDPQRDVGRVLAEAAARGVAVTHVFETHIHNDYVSGGLRWWPGWTPTLPTSRAWPQSTAPDQKLPTPLSPRW